MVFAFLIARLVLAVVFLVAGIAKLAKLAGSRQALHDFGVPAALTDSVQSNQALGLRSQMLLDQGNMSVGRLFGACNGYLAHPFSK